MSRISVEPSVMAWARGSIGLSVSDAAKKLGVSVAVLESWEAGEREPTLAQFRKAAHIYRRPTFVLMLAEPPTDFEPMRDFRRAGAPAMPYWLHVGIRRALEQLEVLEDLTEFAPLVERALPQLHLRMDPERVAGLMRESIGISTDEQRSWSDADTAFRAWRDASARLGVFVAQFENVAVGDARGFSRWGISRGVVGLNSKDASRGKVFTLAHELTHLALGASGRGSVCDLHAHTAFAVERFCNRVAGATLLPADEVRLSLLGLRNLTGDSLLSRLYEVGSRFQVSSEATLIRAIELGYLDEDVWDEIAPELQRRYEHASARRGRKGNFYTTHVSRYGRTYVEAVADAYSSSELTLAETCTALGVKVNQLPKLIGALG